MSTPSEIPRLQTALVGTADGGIAISRQTNLPTLSAGMVLVHTRAISVNPVDTKMVGPYVTPGAVSGCDFAGTVVAIGDQRGNKKIACGDRVFGAVMGMNPLEPELGAFATYVGAPSIGVIKLPPSMSFESASALGTSFMTAGLALFKSLGLPGHPLRPTLTPKPVLVYGGSTATGTAALQLLKLAGFQTIVTCSPHNFPLVKSYGGDVFFDYHSPDCAADIRALTKNNLVYALDCIMTADSMKVCYGAIGRAGGRYTSLDPFLEPIAQTRKAVKADWVLGPAMLGKDIGWPAPHGRPGSPEMKEFGERWVETVQELLDQGKIREHPIAVHDGGLPQVLEGMKLIREKKISGKKLVYRMQ